MTLLVFGMGLAGCTSAVDSDSIPVVGAQRTVQFADLTPVQTADALEMETVPGIGLTEAEFQSLFSDKVAVLDPSLEIRSFEPRRDQPGRGTTLNPNVAIALNSNREGDLIVVALAATNDAPDLKPGQDAIRAFLATLAPEDAAGRVLDTIKQGQEAIVNGRRFRLDERHGTTTLTVTNESTHLQK